VSTCAQAQTADAAIVEAIFYVLCQLSESKVIGAYARVEKFDLEGPIHDRARLPDELIQPRLIDGPPSLGLCINAKRIIRRGTIDSDPEASRPVLGGRRQNEVNVAGMKPVPDAPIGAV
jgi:hypothetical protein